MCCAALAHQNDFDVCWTKGSVAELIFTPLVRSLHICTAFCNTVFFQHINMVIAMS